MPPYSNNKKAKSGFPNPFRTYSNFVYPRTIKDVLDWATYLWERNAAYRSCIQKVVTYFISDITVTQQKVADDVDTKVLDKFKQLLIDDYGLMTLLLQCGEELAALGNVFISAEYVFERMLLCPHRDCNWQMYLNTLVKGRDYEWDGTHFIGTCPQCKRKVVWSIKDIKTRDARGRSLRFVFRAPEDMQIQFNRLTNSFKYLYKMPEDVVAAIKRGDSVYLQDTPSVFLEAAAMGNQLVEFPADMFLAMRTNTLSELDKLYKGWGMPLFMNTFDNIIRRQHLDKFNEAVVLDYLVPTRILTPAPQNLRAGIDDPNRMPMSGAAWKSMMQTAIKGKITNPTQWIISPVPVQELQIGGHKDVIPTDLLEYETTQMLSNMGIPQEFRQSSFQVIAPSMGLRMFERQWVHFAKNLNSFVEWVTKCVAEAHAVENVKCTLNMTSFVEDEANKQILLSLMQGGMLAKTPVLKKLGVDYEEDLKLQQKEQKAQETLMQKAQAAQQSAEMVSSTIPPAALGIGAAQASIQMAQQQGQPQGEGAPAQPAGPAGPAMPAGGMPPMPFNQGASQSASIEQLYQQAQQLAQQLYAAPPNERRAQLVNLKNTNPSLHAMVKQFMTDQSTQVASQAVAQARQPQ